MELILNNSHSYMGVIQILNGSHSHLIFELRIDLDCWIIFDSSTATLHYGGWLWEVHFLNLLPVVI